MATTPVVADAVVAAAAMWVGVLAGEGGWLVVRVDDDTATGDWLPPARSAAPAPARIARTAAAERMTTGWSHRSRLEGQGATRPLELGGADWGDCPEGWSDPFRPTVDPDWLRFPSLGDIFPWQSTGVTANRTWVIAPDMEILQKRWEKLISSKPGDRADLLKTTDARTIDTVVPRIPGYSHPVGTLRADTSSQPHIVPYAYRSFDRQYLILDPRVIDRPRASLWSVTGRQQVFVSEMHTNPVDAGPAVTFAATPPNNEYFQGSHGGRVLPLYRDAAATLPNIAPGLLLLLEQTLGRPVSANDLLTYIAAIVAHPGYTKRYWDDLAVPGVRVSLSGDRRMWDQATEVGREVIRLHTLGTRPGLQPPEQSDADKPDAPKIITAIP